MERSGGDGDGFGEADQGRGILKGGTRNGTARHTHGGNRLEIYTFTGTYL
jgi:hypothetical protein